MSIPDKIRTSCRIAKLFRNWPVLWLLKFRLIPKGRMLTARFRDGRSISFRAGLNEIAFGENLLTEGYSHPALQWDGLRSVVDIGANIGAFCIWLFKRSPAAQYALFEPVPEIRGILQANLAANPALHARLFGSAVAGQRGSATLYIDDDNAGASSLFAQSSPHTRKVQVPTISLNDLFHDGLIGSVDLLKLDCEGAEFEIFSSLEEPNWERIRQVVVETHQRPGRDPQMLVGTLEQHGFKTFRGGRNPNVIWARRS
ncbi:MAG: FkbM family methyltransferase [Lentisphaerales bacterium]|jgi:FkbM family methyltransferase|nr:MAG: FkbM family methyltransferase [Lentisphaerales bacterium]